KNCDAKTQLFDFRRRQFAEFAAAVDVDKARAVDRRRDALHVLEYRRAGLQLDEQHVRTRLIASSRPCPAAESVRAMMMKSGSLRAATAASIFLAASASSMTGREPGRCPQRFGATWSSIWIADTPAASYSRTVWRTLTALP